MITKFARREPRRPRNAPDDPLDYLRWRIRVMRRRSWWCVVAAGLLCVIIVWCVDQSPITMFWLIPMLAAAVFVNGAAFHLARAAGRSAEDVLQTLMEVAAIEDELRHGWERAIRNGH